MGKKKFSLSMPDTMSFLFMLMIACAILTWLIPAGAYDVEKVGKFNKVIAGSYHVIKSTPVGLWGIIMAVPQGFYIGAKLMFTVLMVGGAVGILDTSGAFVAAFGKVARNRNINHDILVFIFMVLMSIAGATAVIANSSVAFIPIGILLATSLGYDKFTGFLIIYMGAFSGFNVGWANIATIGTAQPFAELPIFSGFTARFVIYVINVSLCYFFTVRYMHRIKKNYTTSLNYADGISETEVLGLGAMGNCSTNTTDIPLTNKHIVSLLGLLAAIIALLFGSIKLDWGYNQMSACFFALSVFAGLVNGYGIEGTSSGFLKGCKSCLGAAFIIGFSNGISVVLMQGHILDTIVHWLSIPLAYLTPIASANFMFIANTIIDFFIGSGSGQAIAVMPLMVPLADLTGVTRQVAVQAFQFGDGFSNCIYPNSATLMACLSLVGVQWGKYGKWMVPLLICQAILAFASLTILQYVGWMGI